jgi:hypothetical protein
MRAKHSERLKAAGSSALERWSACPRMGNHSEDRQAEGLFDVGHVTKPLIESIEPERQPQTQQNPKHRPESSVAD